MDHYMLGQYYSSSGPWFLWKWLEGILQEVRRIFVFSLTAFLLLLGVFLHKYIEKDYLIWGYIR